MSWSKELKLIRRIVRDPSGSIWSDAFIQHIYNDIQQHFQLETRVLEDVAAQRVPQLYHFSYQHTWEFGYVPTKYSQIYRCLTQHDSYVVCHKWESQAVTGIDSSVTDYGAHFTQPWEAFSGLVVGEEIKQRFPQNLNSVKFIAYDEEPIAAVTKKDVQTDLGHITREGRPFAYYQYDDTDNSYVLYPKPSVSFQSDIDGDGVAFYESGDTESDDTGTIAVRDDSTPSASVGASVDIIDTVNNVFVIFTASPNDMVSLDDESDFPAFIRKYIRFGTAARIFESNTDGRIPSLGEFWRNRFEIGVEFVKQYVRSRTTDKDYQRSTGVIRSRRDRHPRLPSTYPYVST